ncbi:MAG: 30S ribosomal protein S4 [Flavobacteriales bacterium]|nr:30S ribosomal protein S4 [Flavobacteriales bacterium]
MARYRGPKSKIARRFSDPIFGPDKALDRKGYPPGMHGPNKRRMKQSEYAIQLAEKQKAKYTYGILERQFANIFHRASSSKGITGELLLMFCEARLDNTVFRMGISNTRRGARQLVNHRHITVNGDVVNIPSYTLRPGDVVAVRERSKSLEVVRASVSTSNASKYPWLDFNKETLSGTFVQNPNREDIPENIKEQLIVELYSK